MKKLQNCLYITRQETYLHKERETLVIKGDGEKLMQVPIHSIQHLFCFGNVLVSPFVLGFCGENNVGLSFFTEYGKFLGRLQGVQSGNIFLRKAQYRIAEQDPSLLAQAFIAAKLANCIELLKRHQRNHGEKPETAVTLVALKQRLQGVKHEQNLDRLRGLEGDAAAVYFNAFSSFILNNDFSMSGRNRRPPRDPVNAMLSFAYSLIGKEISSALQGVGLDPQAGFLHADRAGRDSLAQDVLEEFRSWWADRFVLRLINRKEVKPKDFTKQASGAVIFKDDARKQFLASWQNRKLEEITHPYLNEKVPIGLLPHLQALLLARYIRGDIERYPPFAMRG